MHLKWAGFIFFLIFGVENLSLRSREPEKLGKSRSREAEKQRKLIQLYCTVDTVQSRQYLSLCATVLYNCTLHVVLSRRARPSALDVDLSAKN